jgi:CRAL/TRIO domain
MIIIRAPTIFRMVWRIAQSFFAPEVREKMIFAGKDHMETLDKYMDRKIFPACICPEGQGQAARGFPPSFEGGLVPPDFDDSGDDNSYGGNTVQSSVSSCEVSDEQSTSSSTKVWGSSLMTGSLKLSNCGKVFYLDALCLGSKK